VDQRTVPLDGHSLAERNAEDDSCHVVEEVDPLLPLVPLASYVEYPVLALDNAGHFRGAAHRTGIGSIRVASELFYGSVMSTGSLARPRRLDEQSIPF
jgi:hypothetical protein